jgi:hypothetical protein
MRCAVPLLHSGMTVHALFTETHIIAPFIRAWFQSNYWSTISIVSERTLVTSRTTLLTSEECTGRVYKFAFTAFVTAAPGNKILANTLLLSDCFFFFFFFGVFAFLGPIFVIEIHAFFDAHDRLFFVTVQ